MCREFTQEINIGGKIETAFGKACRNADGSWDLSDNLEIWIEKNFKSFGVCILSLGLHFILMEKANNAQFLRNIIESNSEEKNWN